MSPVTNLSTMHSLPAYSGGWKSLMTLRVLMHQVANSSRSVIFEAVYLKAVLNDTIRSGSFRMARGLAV